MIKIKARNASNSPAIAYRDVGNEREHAYMDVGGRAMQEQLPKDAVALLVFRDAEIDHFGPKLIVHDFCRGSLSQLWPDRYSIWFDLKLQQAGRGPREMPLYPGSCESRLYRRPQ